MGIFDRAKNILRSHVNATLDDFKSGRTSVDPDPLADEAATMDDEAWYEAVKARQRHRARSTSERTASVSGLSSQIRDAYDRLNCPHGADLEAVRLSWKRLMKKYHPDRFPHDREKREEATGKAARINAAYHELENYLQAGKD